MEHQHTYTPSQIYESVGRYYALIEDPDFEYNINPEYHYHGDNYVLMRMEIIYRKHESGRLRAQCASMDIPCPLSKVAHMDHEEAGALPTTLARFREENNRMQLRIFRETEEDGEELYVSDCDLTDDDGDRQDPRYFERPNGEAKRPNILTDDPITDEYRQNVIRHRGPDVEENVVKGLWMKHKNKLLREWLLARDLNVPKQCIEDMDSTTRQVRRLILERYARENKHMYLRRTRHFMLSLCMDMAEQRGTPLVDE